MQHPPVAPQHRYRADNHPRSSSGSKELRPSSSCSMAPSSVDSEPCVTPRQPVLHQQPAEAAGTSSDELADQQAATAEARRPIDEPATMDTTEKKKAISSSRPAAECGATGQGLCALEPARRPPASAAAEESARERLKRHRTEMAGRVRIPDMWGQERLLKDWVDCAVFDRPLAATAGLLNARDALVAECAAARRATGRPLRVQNGCS